MKNKQLAITNPIFLFNMSMNNSNERLEELSKPFSDNTCNFSRTSTITETDIHFSKHKFSQSDYLAKLDMLLIPFKFAITLRCSGGWGLYGDGKS